MYVLWVCSAAVAASIVSSDFLSKAGTMYLGERVWNRVSGDTRRRAGMGRTVHGNTSLISFLPRLGGTHHVSLLLPPPPPPMSMPMRVCMVCALQVSWGKKNKGDSASRSVIKAVAWRAFAMVNTLVVSFFIAKSAKTGTTPYSVAWRARCLHLVVRFVMPRVPCVVCGSWPDRIRRYRDQDDSIHRARTYLGPH